MVRVMIYNLYRKLRRIIPHIIFLKTMLKNCWTCFKKIRLLLYDDLIITFAEVKKTIYTGNS